MPIIARHVLCALAIVLCCTFGCVAADDATVGGVLSPKVALQLLIEDARSVKGLTSEVKQAANNANETANEAKAVGKASYDKTTRFVSALRSMRDTLERDAVGGDEESVKEQVLGVVMQSEKAYDALSAAADGAASLEWWLPHAVRWATEPQENWKKQRSTLGPKTSKLLNDAWEKKEEMVTFLTEANTSAWKANAVAVLGNKSAEVAATNAKSLKEKITKNQEKDKWVEVAEQIEKLAKQALEEANKIPGLTDTLVGAAEKAFKSAETMIGFLESALEAFEGEGEPEAVKAPAKPSLPGQSQGEAEQGPQDRIHTPVLHGAQHSSQQTAGTAPASGHTAPEAQAAFDNASNPSTMASDENPPTTVDDNTGSETEKPGINTAQSSAGSSEKDKAAESVDTSASQAAHASLIPPTNNANNTLQDILSADSSVCPSWVRTPLLLVAGVLGLLAVC
ncbi:hypothetical protein DQ04_10911020 [Trypanosoma grayi]|uniref:hypothetical protein n=1 Tax=Trypanosoma grayi TaxID=71804 RepID=UPI0004F4AC1B|nr:hypothetical protein DQ04_10911020 [Trypanosoma grayi]KEG07101.1 hypothetical protein DQ04_10911020 [Trypanosoma grayi]